MTPVFVLTSLFLGASGFVVSEKDSPYNSRMVYTLATCVSVWCANAAGLFAAIKDEQPSIPMRNMMRPLVLASLRTARLMDCLTDVTVVRLLFDQARCMFRDISSSSMTMAYYGPRSWWFGLKTWPRSTSWPEGLE
jgi:hypothetical protein